MTNKTSADAARTIILSAIASGKTTGYTVEQLWRRSGLDFAAFEDGLAAGLEDGTITRKRPAGNDRDWRFAVHY